MHFRRECGPALGCVVYIHWELKTRACGVPCHPTTVRDDEGVEISGRDLRACSVRFRNDCVRRCVVSHDVTIESSGVETNRCSSIALIPVSIDRWYGRRLDPQ